MRRKVIAFAIGFGMVMLGGFVPAAVASADVSPSVSGTLLGPSGEPIVGLRVWISSDPWDGCNFPDPDGPKTQLDGSFRFSFDETYDPGNRYVLCLGTDVYGGETWAWEDRQYVDLSGDLDVGTVQRASSANVSLRWLIDPAFVALANEDSQSQAHAVNVDTGRVYRGTFSRIENGGAWETITVPHGRYIFGVRSLWWDPERWIYYPGVESADAARIVTVDEDLVLPGDVDANPGIFQIGSSAWGEQQDWRIESCDTEWSTDRVVEQFFDPEPDQYVIPVGRFRLAVVRDGITRDWTECIQVAPHGVYQVAWTQKALPAAPISVAASITEELAGGRPYHSVGFEIAPGYMTEAFPTKFYELAVKQVENDAAFQTFRIDADAYPEGTIGDHIGLVLKAGEYFLEVRGMMYTRSGVIYSSPVRSGKFVAKNLAPSPSPTAVPTPTASPTPVPSPSASASPVPSPSPSASVSPVPSPSPSASVSPVPSPSPSTSASEVPGTPPPGAGEGSSGGSNSSGPMGASLAETGAATPPLALLTFALVALVSAGILRLARRRGYPSGGRPRG